MPGPPVLTHARTLRVVCGCLMNAIRSKAEPARPAPNEPAPSILPEALLTAAAAAVRYSAEEERRGELSACTSACPVVHTQSRARAFDSSQWLESFKSVEFTNEDSLTQSVFQCCQVRGFPAQLGYLNCYRVVFHVRGLRRPKRYGDRESSTRCNFRKHIQIEKALANQENI